MSWDDEAPSRPLWLVTLADLSLLLVGFFVLLQATAGKADSARLAAGIRAGFGAGEAAPPPMPVELATVEGFTPGSDVLPDPSGAIAWARAAARDPRTRVTLTGETDGTAADVDASGAAVLAAGRARALATALVRAGAVAPDRIDIRTATGRRRVVLTLGYGVRQ